MLEELAESREGHIISIEVVGLLKRADDMNWGMRIKNIYPLNISLKGQVFNAEQEIGASLIKNNSVGDLKMIYCFSAKVAT